MNTEKNSEMTIRISSKTPHYAFITTKDGLASSEKTVSFDTLTNVLGAHAKRSTPMLPNNLLRMKEDKQSAYYMVQIEPRKRTVEYRVGIKVHTYDIMTPNLVYIAKAENDPATGTVVFGDGHLFATKTKVMTGHEQTYYAPFGNIYRNTEQANRDRICWGREASLGTSLKMIDMHMTFFFQAIFNQDLDDQRFIQHEIDGNQLFKTNHLYAQMNKMFEDGASEEEVLAYVEQNMIHQNNTTVNQYFDAI